VKEKRIDSTEDCRIGADAQHQCQYRNGSEATLLS
jgi:hypothetical protein